MLQYSILLLRGPQNLWLYYILGKQGGVGQLGASGWTELSEALLTPPQVPAQVFQSEAMTADNNPVKFCSHCGKDIIPGTRFCGSCGGAL